MAEQSWMQVLDARDPLRYRSEDLESYSRSLHATKGSILLLNKADLLPAALRIAWADHFDRTGVEYVFWSAKAGIDSLTGQSFEMRVLDVSVMLGDLRQEIVSAWQQYASQSVVLGSTSTVSDRGR